MTFEDALQEYCLSEPGLRSQVGARIYPDGAPPQTQVPYIVRTKLSDPEHGDLEGQVGLGSPTYQFSIFAATAGQRNAVAGALNDALVRYTGGMEPFDVSDVEKIDEADDIETPTDGSERRLFVRRIDLQFWHSREISRAR